jgi:hypothetical protein
LQGFPNLSLFSPNISKEIVGYFVVFQRVAIDPNHNRQSPNILVEPFRTPACLIPTGGGIVGEGQFLP